jgi:hypothetical protein
MNKDDFYPLFEKRKNKPRSRSKTNWTRLAHNEQFQRTFGFKCIHCHAYISSDPDLSGVQNRNHCPYCLWSKHVDLNESGDRLAACKAPMQPAGLCLKRVPKKYGDQNGELMMVHLCCDCGSFSLNRIAADDDTASIFDIYTQFCLSNKTALKTLNGGEICPLGEEDAILVTSRLFGCVSLPE